MFRRDLPPGFKFTKLVMDMVSGLTEDDKVLFLVSGGGSSLFEYSKIDPDELQDITAQMLASGMDIVSMNIIRKRLSQVKGGRFARLCLPAKVYSVILSDILGDPIDMIASGPTATDSSTCAEAERIAEKYSLRLSKIAEKCLTENETPKILENTEYYINGSVKELCRAASDEAKRLGYLPIVLSDQVCCEAREAGSFLASIAKSNAETDIAKAYIIGGETVVHLTGSGKGGRNQEMALACAKGISGLKNVLMFSVGSDGTDGPTDAAGGIVDGNTEKELFEKGLVIDSILSDNDSYDALKAVDGLIFTGATGTNVNDLSVVLIAPKLSVN